MMVSDDGEVKTVRQGKTLRNLLLVLTAVSLAAAGAFYFLWNRARGENDALQRKVAAYQQRLSSLGVDQEELSTLLAIYRPTTRSTVDASAEQPRVEAEAPPVQSKETPAPPPQDDVSAEPDAAPVDVVENGDIHDGAAPLVSPVGIEDFETAIGELSGALTIEFKVTNIDPDLEKAEGHAIVVLRPEGGSGGGLALPPVTLVGGRPTGSEEGQAFSISNFKRVRFTAGAETQPDRFRIATVFIFGEGGELWMEEDFPIRPETSQ